MPNQAPIAPSEGSATLTARVQRAYERIAGDAALTGDLTDEDARILLDRARLEIERLVAATDGLTEVSAQELLAPRIRQLRRRLRSIARGLAQSKDTGNRVSL